MPEMAEAEIIALERRNYRLRIASTSLAGLVFAIVGFVIAWAWIEPTSPIRLTGLQAWFVGAAAAVAIFGTNIAIMWRFRSPRTAMSTRMKLLRADDVQRRAIRGLLWMGGFLLIGVVNSIQHSVGSPNPQWRSTLLFCGLLGFFVCGLTTGLGLAPITPLNDEVTREHRRRALGRSYPAIMAVFVVAYIACADNPSRGYWVFPLALAFSALLPAGLFAFWELRAAGGE